MKITERFKRVADDVIQYQFTVDDPVTYPRPFTMSMPLTPLDGGVLLPYECHEGNLAIRSRSAPSAPRIGRWQRTWPKASSARAAGAGSGNPGGPGGGGRAGGGAVAAASGARRPESRRD